MRFRHLDDDFVRAARQQDFLRQAKEQFGVGKLFADRKELLRIFGRYTQTDIHSDGAILRLLKLAFEATKHPIREVHFPAGIENDASGSYVTITDDDLRKTVREFLEVRGSSGAGARKPTTTTPSTSGTKASAKKKASKKSSSAALAPGLVAAKVQGEDFVATMSTKAGRLPVYYPAVRTTAGFADQSSNPRLYTIRDRAGTAYKRVPDRRLRGRDRPVLRRAGHELDARRRSSTTPSEHDQDARPRVRVFYDGTACG